jgi:hypothetical protein
MMRHTLLIMSVLVSLLCISRSSLAQYSAAYYGDLDRGYQFNVPRDWSVVRADSRPVDVILARNIAEFTESISVISIGEASGNAFDERDSILEELKRKYPDIQVLAVQDVEAGGDPGNLLVEMRFSGLEGAAVFSAQYYFDMHGAAYIVTVTGSAANRAMLRSVVDSVVRSFSPFGEGGA